MLKGAEEKVAEKPEELAVKITFGRQLETGVLQFETYISQNMALVEINKLLDKLHHAGHRQHLHAELARLKLMVENDQVELDRMDDGLAEMDRMVASRASAHAAEGRKGDYKLPEGEKKSRDGILANMKMLLHRKQQTEAKIERVLSELK